MIMNMIWCTYNTTYYYGRDVKLDDNLIFRDHLSSLEKVIQHYYCYIKYVLYCLYTNKNNNKNIIYLFIYLFYSVKGCSNSSAMQWVRGPVMSPILSLWVVPSNVSISSSNGIESLQKQHTTYKVNYNTNLFARNSSIFSLSVTGSLETIDQQSSSAV